MNQLNAKDNQNPCLIFFTPTDSFTEACSASVIQREIKCAAIFINGHSISEASFRAFQEADKDLAKKKRRIEARAIARARIAKIIDHKVGAETFASLRMKKGFTQAQLAKSLNKRQSYLSRMENHRRSIHDKTIDKIASILSVTPNEVRDAFNAQWNFMEEQS